jgi:hypothetical protein
MEVDGHLHIPAGWAQQTAFLDDDGENSLLRVLGIIPMVVLYQLHYQSLKLYIGILLSKAHIMVLPEPRSDTRKHPSPFLIIFLCICARIPLSVFHFKSITLSI